MTEVLLVKTGNRLAAADPISDETISSIKEGEIVTATIRRARKVKHHRKFFKLLSVIHENQSVYPTVDDLLDVIKIATGYSKEVKTLDGNIIIVPKSIRFAKMDQTAFEQFYNSVIDLVVTRILPNTNKNDLVRQINEML